MNKLDSGNVRGFNYLVTFVKSPYIPNRMGHCINYLCHRMNQLVVSNLSQTSTNNSSGNLRCTPELFFTPVKKE